MPSVKSAFRKLTGARRRRQPCYASDEEYDYDCPRVGFDPDDCRVTSQDRDYYALPGPAEDRDARPPGAFPDEEDEGGEEMEYQHQQDMGYQHQQEVEYPQQQDMEYQQQQDMEYQHHQPPTYQRYQAPNYHRQQAPEYQPQVLHYQCQRQEHVRMFATSGPLDDEYELGYGDVSPYVVAEEKEEQKGMNMAGAWVD